MWWLTATIGCALIISWACGSDEKDDTNTATPTPTPASLSSQFTGTCGSCHPNGAAGAGKKLTGTTLTEAQFTTKVRSGVSGTSMQAYTTSTYSDANLKADYAILAAAK
jgi:mono/diheme cytochrome c family protein